MKDKIIQFCDKVFSSSILLSACAIGLGICLFLKKEISKTVYYLISDFVIVFGSLALLYIIIKVIRQR